MGGGLARLSKTGRVDGVQQWIEAADDFGGRRTRARGRGEYLYDQIQTKRASTGENVAGDKMTKSIDELARPEEHHDPLKRQLKRKSEPCSRDSMRLLECFGVDGRTTSGRASQMGQVPDLPSHLYPFGFGSGGQDELVESRVSYQC